MFFALSAVFHFPPAKTSLDNQDLKQQKLLFIICFSYHPFHNDNLANL